MEALFKIRNDMSPFYMTSAFLISYENNKTEFQIEENCKLIIILVDVLDDYPENSDL